MADDLISVVLPTYNGGKYLSESVDSILEQTYKKWELIIVDDCSDDNVPQIADEYSGMDKRIKVIHNSVNMRLPQSLNIGFAAAEGKLLTWTSDDNRFLPDAFQIMKQYFEEHSSAYMVHAKMHGIDEYGVHRQELDLNYGDNICVQNNVGACFMYKREVYESVGGYDADLFCVEDYDYWIRVKKLFGKIDQIDKVLYEYRWHGESLNATKRDLIDRQVGRLREKHMGYILNTLRQDKEALYCLYGDAIKRGCSAALLDGIVQLIPEHKNEIITVSKEAEVIIFGAGEFGRKAALLLADRAVFFADNDKKKIGSVKCGLRIISFEELTGLSGTYCIMVAVDSPSLYSMVSQLIMHGIINYCTYQYYCWHTKRYL